MANNCKNSLVSYGILESGGGVHMTEFGQYLHDIEDEEEQYQELAKHILANLNSMVFIDVLRTLYRNAERIKKKSVVAELNN